MRRTLSLALIALGAVLVWAVPAQAKGVTNATFSGPGLPPGGISVDTSDGSGGAGAVGHQLMEGLGSVFDGYKLDTPPVARGDLGPRYRGTLAFDFAPRPIQVIVYPYAEGGPAMFVPAGQKLGPEFEVPELASGWTSTDTTFLDTLVEIGFPERAPNVTAAPPAATRTKPVPEPAAPSSPWVMPVVVGSILTVLLVGALLVLRSRRHATLA